MDKKQVDQYLDEKSGLLFEASDKIWDFAETAFEEFQSVEVLKKLLSDHGFSIEDKVAGIDTAFCATWGSGAPVVGFLAEFDALSGLSQTPGVAVHQPLAEGGNGHGCGHNMFGAGSVGAALGLKEYLAQNGKPGTVRLYGTPGEEGGSGKAFMARGHAFDGLDVAFAWHPMAFNGLFDTSMLANYQVLYKFRGLAAHAAASPHLGRSALDAVELMNVGVNFLREHVIQEARIHYAITNSGGFSPNVVQPEAEVLYLIRAPRTAHVEEIYQRVNKIAQGAALMTETELEVDFIKACANVVPNKALSAVLYDNFMAQELPTYTAEEQKLADDIFATTPVAGRSATRFATQMPAFERAKVQKALEGKSMCDIVLPFYKNASDTVMPGSSDVGDVSWNVPTAQIVTACYAIGTPEHSWQLVAQGKSGLAHKGLLLAAKVMAGAAIDVVENPALVTEAKEEFTQRLDGEVYHCAIPMEVQPRAISKL